MRESDYLLRRIVGIEVNTPQNKDAVQQADNPSNVDAVEATPSDESGSSGRPIGWPPLDRHARWALVVTIGVLVAATLPRLPPGACYGDAGDMQLAAATLGIMHPPGYTGYVTAGYVTSVLTGGDPAYVVSVMCLAAGLIALAMCMLLQIRLGVSPWIASAMTILLATHHRTWVNLIGAEVYAPTVALLTTAGYLLIKFARTGKQGPLMMAAALFGCAVANRPTVVSMAPFLIIGWWLARRSLPASTWKPIKTLAILTALASAPGVYAIGYLWVRDTPTTGYNYIDMHNYEVGDLPQSTDGWRAKAERIWFHATAREFLPYMGNTWRGAWNRLRWLNGEFLLYQPGKLALLLAIMAMSTAIAYARCPTSVWVLLGLVVCNLVFVATYRIYGMAGDLSTLMLAVIVLGGVAISPLFPAKNGGSKARRNCAIALSLGMCAFTLYDAPNRRYRREPDASQLLSDLDMATLPRNAVICSTWMDSPPLGYGALIVEKRPDIKVINMVKRHWPVQVVLHAGRPIFATENTGELDEFLVTPYRNIWRVEPRPFVPATDAP